MFTGVIADIGEVVAVDKTGDWTLTITATAKTLENLIPGASIACNGICLTVSEKEGSRFKVQVSAETLSKTTALHWKTGARLNLERALSVGDELGGHFLSGHIDGIARVTGKAKDGDSLRYRFEVPTAFARFLAPKGAIALDGVSLTVNEVNDASFDVNIIPFTQSATVLGALEAGDEANFEIDMMARYAERLLNFKEAS
jgi:riboflavin synthase